MDVTVKSGIQRGRHCPDCDVVFESLAKIKYHRLREHGKWRQPLECPHCPKTYSTSSNLRRHLRDVHSEETEGDGGGGPKHTCETCGFISKDGFHLAVHMRKHTGDRPFSCSKCSFAFYKKSDARRHEAGCGGVRHRCEQCKEIFHFRRQLSEHLVWSTTCGSMRGRAEMPRTATASRYLPDKPSVVKVRLDKERVVVGVNCNRLMDGDSFVKRKKRTRCGICESCELVSDCQNCAVCLSAEDGQKRRQLCLRRKCHNLVDQYQLKEGRTLGMDSSSVSSEDSEELL